MELGLLDSRFRVLTLREMRGGEGGVVGGGLKAMRTHHGGFK